MVQFIAENRYPSRIKFSNQQSEAVKNHIKHFNTQEDAKKKKSTAQNESGVS